MGKIETSSSEKWCSLPSDIILLIVDRLTTFADRVRFGGVCAWWRSVIAGTAAAVPPWSPPYLYFIRCSKILCLAEGRKYYLPFEEYLPASKEYKYRLVGTSNGWFGVTDSEDEFYLLDAFSGVRVNLPPLWTLPDVQFGRLNSSENVMSYFLKTEVRVPDGPERTPMSACYLRKRLMHDFTLSPTMTALISYRRAKKLALARPGCEDWTQVAVPAGFPREAFIDIAYHHSGSHDKFYAIQRGGATVSVDENCGDIVVETVVADNNFRPRSLVGGPHLVSLGTGGLLCVYILPPADTTQLGNTEAVDFNILKLVRDAEKDEWTWARVERLDDWALFLDCHGVRARFYEEGGGGGDDDVGYNGNHIYFALDHKTQRSGKKIQYLGCGVFDILTKSINPMDDSKKKAFWLEP